MSTTEITLDVCFPSTEFKTQAVVNTVPDDYEETVSLKISVSGISQKTNPIAELEKFLDTWFAEK